MINVSKHTCHTCKNYEAAPKYSDPDNCRAGNPDELIYYDEELGELRCSGWEPLQEKQEITSKDVGSASELGL